MQRGGGGGGAGAGGGAWGFFSAGREGRGGVWVRSGNVAGGWGWLGPLRGGGVV